MTAALDKSLPRVPIVKSAFLLGSVAPDLPLWLLSIGSLIYYHFILARLYPFKRRKPDYQLSAQAMHGGFLPSRSMTLTWKKYKAIKTGARVPSHQ